MAKNRKRSFWKYFRDRFRHKKARIQNRPMYFPIVDEGEGKDVGHAIPVFYPSFHDMAGHQIMGQLTSVHLIDGLQFNACRILFQCRVGDYQCMTVVQPVQTEGDKEEEIAA